MHNDNARSLSESLTAGHHRLWLAARAQQRNWNLPKVGYHWGMTTTGIIPAKLLSGLEIHSGDTLRVLAVTASDVVVALQRDDSGASRPAGRASAWLRSAKGSIRLAPGESVDDARMAHLRRKHGL